MGKQMSEQVVIVRRCNGKRKPVSQLCPDGQRRALVVPRYQAMELLRWRRDGQLTYERAL